MKDIEIEIKVKITDIAPLLKFLQKSAKFISKQQQVDRYYNPPGLDFFSERPVKHWLRLRQETNGTSSINYKLWHHQKDGTPTYCDEYESKLSDIPGMQKIFKALNFREAVKVDKVRKVWFYHDSKRDYEIAVDSVKNLGDFVEIEYKGKSSKVAAEKINLDMIKLLKDLGCGEIERNYDGYAFQLLFKNEIARKKTY